MWLTCILFFFFFNDTATTEIYTLSLHDALPISLNTLSPFGNDAGSETYDHQNENHLDGNRRHAQKTAQQPGGDAAPKHLQEGKWSVVGFRHRGQPNLHSIIFISYRSKVP